MSRVLLSNTIICLLLRLAVSQPTEQRLPVQSPATEGLPGLTADTTHSLNSRANSYQPATQCFFYIQELRSCGDLTDAYSVNLDMRDPGGERIDAASRQDVVAASIEHPLEVGDGGKKLKQNLIIAGQYDALYDQAVHFKYGDLEWTSADNDPTAKGYCDPSDGWSIPTEGCNYNKRRGDLTERQFALPPKVVSNKQITCYFECQ